MLKKNFELILFMQDFNSSVDIVCINSEKVRPFSINKLYLYYIIVFYIINIYEYFWEVLVMKYLQ